MKNYPAGRGKMCHNSSKLTISCLFHPILPSFIISNSNYLFAYWVHAFLSSAEFFQNQLFRKILSGIPSECQTAWIQIRPDILSDLIWVQNVCKSYQQTITVGKELSNRQQLTAKNCPYLTLIASISILPC